MLKKLLLFVDIVGITSSIILISCIVMYFLLQPPVTNWEKVGEDIPYNWRQLENATLDGTPHGSITYVRPQTKGLKIDDVRLIMGKPLKKFTVVRREENTSDRPEVLTFYAYKNIMFMESDVSAQARTVSLIIKDSQ